MNIKRKLAENTGTDWRIVSMAKYKIFDVDGKQEYGFFLGVEHKAKEQTQELKSLKKRRKET